jgi:hypothetical protein
MFNPFINREVLFFAAVSRDPCKSYNLFLTVQKLPGTNVPDYHQWTRVNVKLYEKCMFDKSEMCRKFFLQ